MNTRYKTLLFVLGLALVGAGCNQVVELPVNSGDTPPAEAPIEEPVEVRAEEEVAEPEEAAVEEVEEETVAEGEEDKRGETVELAGPGEFVDYDPALLSRAGTGDVVLFFHAAWCPSCKALEADINRNASDIPGDLTILKTDYDKELDLKRKYGVTYQHTMVQVDAQGTLIKKWSGKNSLASLVGEVQ